jgi:hypothetical protein
MGGALYMVGLGIDGDNIKVDRKGITFESVNWIHLLSIGRLAYSFEQVMNHGVP